MVLLVSQKKGFMRLLEKLKLQKLDLSETGIDLRWNGDNLESKPQPV